MLFLQTTGLDGKLSIGEICRPEMVWGNSIETTFFLYSDRPSCLADAIQMSQAI